MALEPIYISGIPGLHYVEDSRLHEAVEIMLVLREGKPYVEVSGTPVGKQFRHAGSEMRIYFDINFPFAAMVDDAGTVDFSPEEVTIQIKY